ncbi:hypothetical protein DM02DRAFT_623168 [Periconia macrospinosa]|uniref:Uncharacterized protein n=1 Tax=Periconia macrospinosa TaxID=97972 RepID=A0A2V1EA73_9PLEO|nr:hypothetical protein DM02DRAFT_623168 [Periconia macrospinosa]
MFRERSSSIYPDFCPDSDPISVSPVAMPQPEHYQPGPQQRGNFNRNPSFRTVSEISESEQLPISHFYNTQGQPQHPTAPPSDSGKAQQHRGMFDSLNGEPIQIAPLDYGPRESQGGERRYQRPAMVEGRGSVLEYSPRPPDSNEPQKVNRMHIVSLDSLKKTLKSRERSRKTKRAHFWRWAGATISLAFIIAVVALIFSILAFTKHNDSENSSLVLNSSSQSSGPTVHTVSSDASRKTDSTNSLATARPTDVTVSQTLTHRSSISRPDFTANTISPSPTSKIILSTTFVQATVTEVVNDMPSSRSKRLNDIEEAIQDDAANDMNTRMPAGSPPLSRSKPLHEPVPNLAFSSTHGRSSTRTFFNRIPNPFKHRPLRYIAPGWRAYRKSILAANAQFLTLYTTTSVILGTVLFVIFFALLLVLWLEFSWILEFFEDPAKIIMEKLKELLGEGKEIFNVVLDKFKDKASEEFMDKIKPFETTVKDVKDAVTGWQDDLKGLKDNINGIQEALKKVEGVKDKLPKFPRQGDVSWPTSSLVFTDTINAASSVISSRFTALASREQTTSTAKPPAPTISTFSTSFYPLSTTIPNIHQNHTMSSNAPARPKPFKLSISLAWLVVIATAALFVGVAASDDQLVQTQTLPSVDQGPRETTSLQSVNRVNPTLIRSSTSTSATHSHPSVIPAQKRSPGLPGFFPVADYILCQVEKSDQNAATQTSAPEPIPTIAESTRTSTSGDTTTSSPRPRVTLKNASYWKSQVPLAFNFFAKLKSACASLFPHLKREHDPKEQTQQNRATSASAVQKRASPTATTFQPQTSFSISSVTIKTITFSHEITTTVNGVAYKTYSTWTATITPISLPTTLPRLKRISAPLVFNSTAIVNGARGLRVPFPFAMLPHLRNAYGGFFGGDKRQNEDIEVDLEEKKKGSKGSKSKSNPEPTSKPERLPNGTERSGATSGKISIGWRQITLLTQLQSVKASLFGSNRRQGSSNGRQENSVHRRKKGYWTHNHNYTAETHNDQHMTDLANIGIGMFIGFALAICVFLGLMVGSRCLFERYARRRREAHKLDASSVSDT